MDERMYDTWVKQLRGGSREAFTRLYMVYSDQVYGFALKLTKSPQEAEDILQETFMRLWDNRSGLRTDTSFKSYLFRITYHLVIDSFRKQIDSVDFENFINSRYYQSASDNPTEHRINYDDYRRLIEKSLSSLSARQQQIYRLSREEGYSAKEIGTRLCISEKTVNNQLSFILAKLKTDLLLFFIGYVL